MAEDYGKYVVGPLEWALAGQEEERWNEVSTVHAAPGYITPSEMCQAFERGTYHLQPWRPRGPRLTELPYVSVSGKKVSYAPVPDDQLYAILQPFGGDRAAGCVVEMYKGIREVGCTSLSLKYSRILSGTNAAAW